MHYSPSPKVYQYNTDYRSSQFENIQPRTNQNNVFYPKPSINFTPITFNDPNMKESVINKVYEPYQKIAFQQAKSQSNPPRSTFSANQLYFVNKPNQIKDAQIVSNSQYKLQNNEKKEPRLVEGQRFDQYLDQEQSPYKYNIFSVIDQPWNRCTSGRNCGTCPSNQCISRSTIKQQWSK